MARAVRRVDGKGKGAGVALAGGRFKERAVGSGEHGFGPKALRFAWRDDPAVPAFDDSQPLIVFDGDCVFCSRSMRRVARMDPAERLRMTPAQGPLGQALYRFAGLPTDRFDTYLVLVEGRMFARSDALVAMAGQLSIPWRLLRFARIVPRPLRDAAYGLLARHRYRLFGRVEACGLADPALARRLV